MPVLKEQFSQAITQKPFSREMISPELEKVFRYVMSLPERCPSHIDDVTEVMEELDDDDLARICGVPAGPESRDAPAKILHYSCTLRQRLNEELEEIDMALDVALADGTSLYDGWLIELLDEGTVTAEEPKKGK